MSVADRLNKLSTDITNAYTSIENKGGTIPANKNTENMSTAIDSIEVIEQATAEGESISLVNTKAMPYSDYVVEGKSEQATRSGKNLAKLTGTAVAGISFIDSEISITGTFNNNAWQGFNSISLLAGTYTLSFVSDFTNGTYFLFNNQQTTSKKVTITINENTNVSLGLVLFSGTYNNNIIKVQIEQGSTATSYEPYGASPSPEYPSEIHSVADDVNLINESLISADIYGLKWEYDSNNKKVKIYGTANNTYSAMTSRECNIPAGTYKFVPYGNTSLNYNLWLYNSSNQLIGNTKVNNPVTINETAVKFSVFVEGLTSGTTYNESMSFKIQKGTTATPYSPYNQGTVTIKQRRKNLIDNNNLQYDFSNIPNTYNQLETIETGIRYSTTYPDGTPMIIFNTGIDLTSHIGKTIKMKSTISSNAGSIRVGIANADTSLRQYKANTNISNKEISFLVTDDLGEKKYLIYYLAIDVGIGNTADFKNLTLTIDEEPIYEPYQANDYTFQTEPLRSLPNGVKDTIEEDGIHRRVGRVVLDGTESGWYKQDNTSYSEDYLRFTIGITDKKNASNPNSKKDNILSNNFTNKILDNNSTRKTNSITGQFSTNLINIFVAQNIINGSKVEDFKTWLSNNPTELLYELAEEIIEPLTQNQATTMLDIIKTGSYEGTTNIYTDEDVKPTIGVGYYKIS